MKFTLKNTQDQRALFAAIGSKDRNESAQAMEAYAAFIAPVAQEVLMQASTASAIYRTVQFNEDDSPSIPLDLYFDEGTEFIQTWSQELPGGLGTSHVEGLKEMKISTYELYSAVSFNKKYARKARLNVLEKATERMINEMLVKQERNAWVPVLNIAASGNIAGKQNTFRANTATVFGLDDLNKMITRSRRINQSYASGTPSNYQYKGLTNLFVSPEVKEQVRAFVYQPMNTRNGATTTSGATSIALPDNVREQIYRSAGAQSVFDIEITELNELGVNAKYNTLFDTLAGSTTFYKSDGTSGGASFAATDELIVGIDASRDAYIRAVVLGSDNNEITVFPDDQFVARQDKTGFYATLQEGRVAVDARASVNLIL